MNTVQNKVFGCDELRRTILSYIPKRCKSCHQKISVKYNQIDMKSICNYNNYKWRELECIKFKGYCNWCYYYVFEYR